METHAGVTTYNFEKPCTTKSFRPPWKRVEQFDTSDGGRNFYRRRTEAVFWKNRFRNFSSVWQLDIWAAVAFPNCHKQPSKNVRTKASSTLLRQTGTDNCDHEDFEFLSANSFIGYSVHRSNSRLDTSKETRAADGRRCWRFPRSMKVPYARVSLFPFIPYFLQKLRTSATDA